MIAICQRRIPWWALYNCGKGIGVEVWTSEKWMKIKVNTRGHWKIGAVTIPFDGTRSTPSEFTYLFHLVSLSVCPPYRCFAFQWTSKGSEYSFTIVGSHEWRNASDSKQLKWNNMLRQKSPCTSCTGRCWLLFVVFPNVSYGFTLDGLPHVTAKLLPSCSQQARQKKSPNPDQPDSKCLCPTWHAQYMYGLRSQLLQLFASFRQTSPTMTQPSWNVAWNFSACTWSMYINVTKKPPSSTQFLQKFQTKWCVAAALFSTWQCWLHFEFHDCDWDWWHAAYFCTRAACK